MVYASSCILKTGTTCYSEDVVFLAGGGNDSWRCGQAKYFFNAGGMLLCLLDVFTFCESRPGIQCSKWKPTAALQLLELDQILQVAIYTQGKNGQFTALTPSPLSCQK